MGLCRGAEQNWDDRAGRKLADRRKALCGSRVLGASGRTLRRPPSGPAVVLQPYGFIRQDPLLGPPRFYEPAPACSLCQGERERAGVGRGHEMKVNGQTNRK